MQQKRTHAHITSIPSANPDSYLLNIARISSFLYLLTPSSLIKATNVYSFIHYFLLKILIVLFGLGHTGSHLHTLKCSPTAHPQVLTPGSCHLWLRKKLPRNCGQGRGEPGNSGRTKSGKMNKSKAGPKVCPGEAVGFYS